MNNIHVTSVVTVDATSVIIESLWHSDVASNGSSLVDLLHHVLLTLDVAKLINSICHVFVRDETGLTWVAVTANVHGRADLTNVIALGTIDGARLISDLVIGHPFERVISIASMAPVILGLARDDNLGGDVNIGPGGLTGNLNSIRDG